MKQITRYRMIARTVKKDEPLAFAEIKKAFFDIYGYTPEDNNLRIHLKTLIGLGMIKRVKMNKPLHGIAKYRVGYVRLVDLPPGNDLPNL